MRPLNREPALPAQEAPAQDLPALPDAVFRKELLELIPFLRAFSRSLCGNRDAADDLAQDALAKAWQSRASFRPGSNLKAWLFTILRNQFYSDRRRSWRQTPLDTATAERIQSPRDEQNRATELSDTTRALYCLPPEQREALILVGVGGFSYEEAAAIGGCAVGTVKSRVARARHALIAMLDGKTELSGAERLTGREAAHKLISELQRLSPHADSCV